MRLEYVSKKPYKKLQLTMQECIKNNKHKKLYKHKKKPDGILAWDTYEKNRQGGEWEKCNENYVSFVTKHK